MAGYGNLSRGDLVKLVLLAVLVLFLASWLLQAIAADTPHGRTKACLERHPHAGAACIDEEDR